MTDIPSHHLIHGTLIDYLTGETLVHTDDERIRQAISIMMIEDKGYLKEDLEPRLKIETLFSGQFVVSRIELVVRLNGRRLLLLRYGPGSLVTRERPAIAAARVLDPDNQIPYAVVTNGIDAELIDTVSGKVLGQGLAAIPTRDNALNLLATTGFSPYNDPKKRERELRILNFYDVEICCAGGPCALPGAKEG